MRLRTLESFWLLKNGLLYTYPLLEKNISTEIVVVGGGVTGALISTALLQEGYKVVLVDRRDIGQGSTSATTSMLQYEIDEQLQDLSKKIGEEGAVDCYKAGISAIIKLGKLVQELKIDCGYEKKMSLYVAHNQKAADKLYKEYEIRNKHKLGVQWLSASAVLRRYGIVCHGAILSKTAASIDAYKLAHELIQRNCKNGMQVYDQTAIKSFHQQKNGVQIKTVDGYTVNAKKVIFCNGFESTSLLKEKIADLEYTYAMVSEPNIAKTTKLKDVLVWDTNDPYLYLRTTDDGRLLVGGEDSAFKDTIMQQEIKEQKAKKLQQKLKKLVPSYTFIEDFNWGGVFGSTKDGLPYIGASPEFKNALWVLGFGGNGITFSVQGMDIVLAMLKGEAPAIAHWYRFGR